MLCVLHVYAHTCTCTIMYHSIETAMYSIYNYIYIHVHVRMYIRTCKNEQLCHIIAMCMFIHVHVPETAVQGLHFLLALHT